MAFVAVTHQQHPLGGGRQGNLLRGRTDRRTDGRTDRQTARRKDGWTDGRTGRARPLTASSCNSPGSYSTTPSGYPASASVHEEKGRKKHSSYVDPGGQ
jgi:hypothetical protein